MPPPKLKFPPPIAWDADMKLPPGARLPQGFVRRLLRDESRIVGCGTVEDPRISWVSDENYREYPTTEVKFLAIEAIVREQTRNLGLSYVWIAKEEHGTSIVARTKNGKPIKSDDDNHITLRMGTNRNMCNIHGHFYLIFEDHSLANKAIRMMEDHERGVVGGKNPQLWVWGHYPREYKRSAIKYPKSPFEIKSGSILDKQIQRDNEEDERKKELETKIQRVTLRK